MLILNGALPTVGEAYSRPSGWRHVDHGARLKDLHMRAKNPFRPREVVEYIVEAKAQAVFQNIPQDQLNAIDEELAYWVARRME